jgi:hypothetical protein
VNTCQTSRVKQTKQQTDQVTAYSKWLFFMSTNVCPPIGTPDGGVVSGKNEHEQLNNSLLPRVMSTTMGSVWSVAASAWHEPSD